MAEGEAGPAATESGTGTPGRQRPAGGAQRANPAVIDHRAQRIGLGMLASLLVGFDPLRDAITGVGSFEGAIGRYLLCLGGSVGAVLVLGHLLDGAAGAEGDGGADRSGPPPSGA